MRQARQQGLAVPRPRGQFPIRRHHNKTNTRVLTCIRACQMDPASATPGPSESAKSSSSNAPAASTPVAPTAAASATEAGVQKGPSAAAPAKSSPAPAKPKPAPKATGLDRAVVDRAWEWVSRLGMTRAKLAEELGVSSNTISKIAKYQATRTDSALLRWVQAHDKALVAQTQLALQRRGVSIEALSAAWQARRSATPTSSSTASASASSYVFTGTALTQWFALTLPMAERSPIDRLLSLWLKTQPSAVSSPLPTPSAAAGGDSSAAPATASASSSTYVNPTKEDFKADRQLLFYGAECSCVVFCGGV
jgi:hypothetical protein